MLRLYLAGKSGTRDISQLVETMTWSGDKAGIARQLTASVLQGPGWPVPAVGDGVTMGDEEGALFTGYVVRRGADSERSRLTVTCHDRGMYLRRRASARLCAGTGGFPSPPWPGQEFRSAGSLPG